MIVCFSSIGAFPSNLWPGLEDFERFSERLLPPVPDLVAEIRILLCFALLYYLEEWGYFRRETAEKIYHLGPKSELPSVRMNKFLVSTGQEVLVKMREVCT